LIDVIPYPQGNSDEHLEERFEALLELLRARFAEDDIKNVALAWSEAKKAHRGQKRKSGEAYISHPLAVGEILAHMGMDIPSVIAGLLHDALEDTPLDEAYLRREFGDDVARLVVGVTKISAIEARETVPALHEDHVEAESLRKMLLASVGDLRVILIKLADRLHNMRTLAGLSEARAKRMALETLEIYSPLANRLGIWQIKSELEDKALDVLEPQAVKLVSAVLAGRREEHERYLDDAMAALRERLERAGIKAELKSRAKHLYSIWHKMQRKDLEADQILDVLALRVIVDDLAECYLALGVVHSMWQPMEGEFDDYIAKKKPNWYQSLHTTVLGPDKRPLEVQIRTRAMNEVAEYGVAAHWMYKEDAHLSESVQAQITALRRMFESHAEDAPDAVSFVENLKTDVFRDQVYVFTPKGQVIELPLGATPVDFAYHIHTDVGHACRRATVDGRIVPLNTPLETGQMVEIFTAKGENIGPSRDWANPSLGYVVSSRARNKIKQFFRRQRLGEAIRAGREILERQLRKCGMTKTKHDAVAGMFGYGRLEDFLAAIGRHEIASQTILQRLLEQDSQADDDKAEREAAPPSIRQPDSTAGVMILGSELQSNVAGCCKPIHGDSVVGYLTRGRGVTLHRRDCRNIAGLMEREPDRFIQVEWPQADFRALPVELMIYAFDRSGLARDVTDVISRNGLNMLDFKALAREQDGKAWISAVVAVSSREELVDLIDKLEAVKNVIQVRRRKG